MANRRYYKRKKSFFQKVGEVVNPLMTFVGFAWTVIQILDYKTKNDGTKKNV